MVSLGHPSLPPTDLGGLDDEEASPGMRLLHRFSTGLFQGHINFAYPEIGVGSRLRVLTEYFFFRIRKCRSVFKWYRKQSDILSNTRKFIQCISERLPHATRQGLTTPRLENPTSRAQLLQVISKFEERYSARETQGSRKNYNERRYWDVRRNSPDDHRNRNWRDEAVLDRHNDRRDNYRSTYGNITQKNRFNQGFEHRYRNNRRDHRFENSGGRNQLRNRGLSESFNRGDRR
ncbi:hypothetical protein TNCV_2179201 [Trichonephila clavipes]|uniref:Uncharacterized protein n=1 Tax=Trichonephila clavipes TaxID=2585209 RepID=A0A8X6VUG2_TRICX|nr:hypothetical protein TNCV_2179201 [Trichonephila clavipes]